MIALQSTPNFRINGESHDSKPHKQRTKCIDKNI